MNYKETKRLAEITKLVRDMKRLKEILACVDHARKQKELALWMREHKDALCRMSSRDLEEIREKADYDKVEWQKMVDQLRL